MAVIVTYYVTNYPKEPNAFFRAIGRQQAWLGLAVGNRNRQFLMFGLTDCISVVIHKA
jgi:hypothetical protein